METIQARMQELKSGTLSRYIVELMAYDLRERHLHAITGPFAHEPADVQQAIDLAINANFEQGAASYRDRMKWLLEQGFRHLDRLADPRGARQRARLRRDGDQRGDRRRVRRARGVRRGRRGRLSRGEGQCRARRWEG